jgi:hypothetical protein
MEEGGRRTEEGGRGKEEGGRRKEEEGMRKEEGGRRKKDLPERQATEVRSPEVSIKIFFRHFVYPMASTNSSSLM